MYDEEFKICPCNTAYEVSQYGRIKDRNGIIPQYVLPNGCLAVKDITGRREHESVHRLVALTWLENQASYGLIVHHKNNNGFDNRVDNLQWVSNEEHREIHGY